MFQPHVSLALAISAYEQWLATDDESLHGLLDDAMQGLRDYVIMVQWCVPEMSPPRDAWHPA